MSELLTNYTPQILDFMVVALLLCGMAVRMHKGLYNALMPLAVVGAAAVCGMTLSLILTGPITELVMEPVTEAFVKDYDYGLVTVKDYDTILAALENGMTDEVRAAIDITRFQKPVEEAAADAGDRLAALNEEVLTDENFDKVLSLVENNTPEEAQKFLEEKGMSGDEARTYLRVLSDALGSAGDTVLTRENVNTAFAVAQKEIGSGAEMLLGDGSEAREGREAVRAAGENEHAAVRAAVSALLKFLVPRYVRVIVFLLGWTAFTAVLTTLKNTLGLAFDLPVIKQVDKLGGAALGFAEVAVVLWLFFWVIRYLGFNVFREYAKNTMVLRFFA